MSAVSNRGRCTVCGRNTDNLMRDLARGPWNSPEWWVCTRCAADYSQLCLRMAEAKGGVLGRLCGFQAETEAVLDELRRRRNRLV